MKILAVCLGNICRSPLAEGLLRREVEKRNLLWEIDSAGTASYHLGNPPDPRSIAIAARHGLDISTQRSRPVTANDLDYYDVLLAMDRQNVSDLLHLAKTDEQRCKIKLLLEFTGVSSHTGPDVFDPYWSDNGFSTVYTLIEEVMPVVVDILVTE